MAKAGVDPNSDEFKQAKNRVLTSWQATMQSVGEKMPQPGKGGKKKQDDSPLAAVYQAAVSTGPPVFHQIAPYLTPQYQAQKKQGAQTAATQAQGQSDTTAAGADKEKLEHDLSTAVTSGAPQDQVDKIKKQLQDLSPEPKPTPGTYKEFKRPDGTLSWYDVSKPETIPAGSTAVGVGSAGKTPKEGWTKVGGKWGSQLYDPETNQPIPDTFNSSKVPPSSVLSMFPQEHTFRNFFVDSNGVRQEFTSTNTTERSLPHGMGDSGTAPRTMVTPSPKGLVERGNIPIDNRPTVSNSDGTHSSEYSVSFNQDGREVLVPTVVGGKFLTPDGKKPKEGSPEEKTMFKAAWQHYLDTGEHLGKFDSPDSADAYADQLHNRGAISHQPKTPTAGTGTPPPASGGSKTTPIGYVGSLGYKQAVKQATDAQKEFNGASTNLSLMAKTAKAAKNGDGEAQMGIVSSYLKTVVGGQGTGVRITKAEWDAATKTRPLLEGAKATFSPDGFMTGAAISDKQVDQMVQEVHQKTKALYDNLNSAKQRVQDQKKTDMDAGGLSQKLKPVSGNSASGFDWNAHPVAQ
jgi:hypothetical protein